MASYTTIQLTYLTKQAGGGGGGMVPAAILNSNNVFHFCANALKFQDLVGNLSGINLIWSVSVS